MVADHLPLDVGGLIPTRKRVVCSPCWGMVENRTESGTVHYTEGGSQHVATWVKRHTMLTVQSPLGNRSATVSTDSNLPIMAEAMLAELVKLHAAKQV